MTLLLTLLIMAVLALVAAVAAGRITGGLDAAASTVPGRGLPPGPVTVEDVEQVRFSPAFRGYRMEEVDDVLDRLTDELRRRDDEIAELRRRPSFGAPAEDVQEVPERFWGPPPNGHLADPFTPPSGEFARPVGDDRGDA